MRAPCSQRLARLAPARDCHRVPLRERNWSSVNIGLTLLSSSESRSLTPAIIGPAAVAFSGHNEGVGLCEHAICSRTVSLSVGYSGVVGANARDHAARATLGIRF